MRGAAGARTRRDPLRYGDEMNIYGGTIYGGTGDDYCEGAMKYEECERGGYEV